MMEQDNDSSVKVPNHKNSAEVNVHQLSEIIIFGNLVTANKQQEFEITKGTMSHFIDSTIIKKAVSMKVSNY